MTDGSSKPGLGIDVVAISRIRRLLEDHPERFREYAFSPGERRYCDEQAAPAQHFAARWAAKEAFIKAVGIEGTSPDLSTIEVVGGPVPGVDLAGDGRVLLMEAAAARDSTAEEATVTVSLSHEPVADMALAVVLVQF